MTEIHVPKPRWKHAALIAYLVMVTVAVIAVGNETHQVQDRIVQVERNASPCARYGPDSKQCSASLTRVVSNLSASQACVIVEAAGYKCRAQSDVDRQPGQERGEGSGDSSDSPSDLPLAPGSTPGGGASGSPTTPSPSSPTETPPAPPGGTPAPPGGPEPSPPPPALPDPPRNQEGPLVDVNGVPAVPCVGLHGVLSVNC